MPPPLLAALIAVAFIPGDLSAQCYQCDLNVQLLMTWCEPTTEGATDCDENQSGTYCSVERYSACGGNALNLELADETLLALQDVQPAGMRLGIWEDPSSPVASSRACLFNETYTERASTGSAAVRYSGPSSR